MMDGWMVIFLVKLDDAGVKLWAAIKYVDDVNVVCNTIAKGWRWEQSQLVWKQEWEQEEENHEPPVSDELRTMSLIREAADEVIPWLSFTLDVPELHASNKVPMLDIEVWVDKMDGREDLLLWDFFEKTSASSRVLQATSTYNWRAKLVCMNMELFRRHRNTSRQVTMDRRVEIIDTFTTKLRRSGYGVSTVSRIIEEGSKFYYRKVRIELEGGPELNQRLEGDLVMSRRMKMGASETWFARKRGGAKECWQKENGWRSGPQEKGQRRVKGPGQKSSGGGGNGGLGEKTAQAGSCTTTPPPTQSRTGVQKQP